MDRNTHTGVTDCPAARFSLRIVGFPRSVKAMRGANHRPGPMLLNSHHSAVQIRKPECLTYARWRCHSHAADQRLTLLNGHSAIIRSVGPDATPHASETVGNCSDERGTAMLTTCLDADGVS